MQLSFFVLLSISQIIGQEDISNPQLFLIHEDQVLPYMADEYEDALKNFKNMISNSDVDMKFNVAQTEYFTYSAIMPVNDYEGLSKHFAMTGDMIKKIGKDKFSTAMKKFDGCYDSHKNYLLKLRNDLSYKPKYGLDSKDGLNFRHFDFFHFIPGKEEEMIKLIKEWKEMNEVNNIQQGYRIYQGDLGTDSPMLLMVKSFKDRVSWATESEEISKKLGDQQKVLRKKMISLMQKFEHKNGNMRPDLGLTK